MPRFELDSTWFEYPQEEKEGVKNNDKAKKHSNNGGAAFIPKTIVKLRIKGSCKSIPASTFSHQPKLTYLEIQQGVSTVGDYCFYKCPYLFEVHCPMSLHQMGVYAFSQATLLTEVTLSKQLQIIPASAFEYCESLATICIPASVQSIHHYAFFHCTSLANVQFETMTQSTRILGLQEIHDHAFGSCISLQNIKLPLTLTKLFANAFCDCLRLQQVQMAEGLQTIERRAFSGCTSLQYLEIPSTVEDFVLADVQQGCSSKLKVRQRSPGDVFSGIGGVDKDLYRSDQAFYRSATRNVSAATMRMKQSFDDSNIRCDDKCFNPCNIM